MRQQPTSLLIRGTGVAAAILRWVAAFVGLAATVQLLFLGIVPGLMLLGLAMICGKAAQKFQMTVDRAAILNRSKDAEHIVRLLKERCPAGRYFLYLRPFFSDTQLIENPRKSVFPFRPSFYYPRYIPWETVFSDAVHAEGAMIALGVHSEFTGAAKIQVSDEQWLQMFVLLATFADVIFIWPSRRRGTSWEIEWLAANRYIPKCVFCIPEEYDSVVEQTDDSWLSVRASLLAAGFEVPQQSGVLFTVAPPRQMPLRIGKRRRFMHALRAFIAPLSGTYAVGFADHWDAYEKAIEQLPETLPVAPEDDATSRLTCVECGRLLPVGAIVCPLCDRLL